VEEDAQRRELERGYAVEGPSVVLGAPVIDGAPARGLAVAVGLGSLTRHGLIAGATGTGKTRTLQLIAGQLSAAGVPSLVADVKGDLTGMAVPADPAEPRVAARVAELGLPWAPAGHPVELLSLSGRLGRPLHASVRSFGPTLLARVLDLNATQTAVLAVAFRAAEDRALPLDTLDDLRAVLAFLASDEGEPVLRELGGVSPASLGVILRALVLLEGEGAGRLFGLPELDVGSLLRLEGGAGLVSLLELSDVVRSPRLHSTFMLWLLVRLYDLLPEAGDLPRPKLVVFLDEAHLLFDDAPEPLLDQIEQTVRLIRSKGVGVVLVTQAPTDCARHGARPARQPRPARAARVHAGRRDGAAADGAHLSAEPLHRR
jgi:DNA helicase HerA-like ATPase